MQPKHDRDSPERSSHRRRFEETKLHKYAEDRGHVRQELRFPYLGDAMEMLSKMYRKGLGTEADSEKSQYWKAEAAQYKLF